MSKEPCTSYNCTKEFSIVKIDPKEIVIDVQSPINIPSKDNIEENLKEIVITEKTQQKQPESKPHKMRIYNNYTSTTIRIKK